jgi:hypothetical protein
MRDILYNYRLSVRPQEGGAALENAHRLFRKAVHSDVTALLNAGVLDRATGGGVVFPYEAVKVEFLLRAVS